MREKLSEIRKEELEAQLKKALEVNGNPFSQFDVNRHSFPHDETIIAGIKDALNKSNGEEITIKISKNGASLSVSQPFSSIGWYTFTDSFFQPFTNANNALKLTCIKLFLVNAYMELKSKNHNISDTIYIEF